MITIRGNVIYSAAAQISDQINHWSLFGQVEKVAYMCVYVFLSSKKKAFYTYNKHVFADLLKI